MALRERNSICFLCQEFRHAYSFGMCCCFFLGYLLFTLVVLGLATLIIIFILKPRKPIFSLQAVNLDSYKLDVYSGSTLFVSSVVSLTLNAQNPNKVGIRYSPSRLHVLNEGLVIGMIRVPGFYQPASSNNVSLQMRGFFQCVNISRILSGVSPQDDMTNTSIFQLRLFGDITARLHVFHFNLPKIKVAMDCDIDIDYRQLTFSNEISSMRGVLGHIAYNFPISSQTFAKKCSMAVYI
ncbi:unnamed protein product [Ilex paraguariensis]|uniref:Late embryogenesis abundant protein LEA-2 subgroup domain-containing protein n=1 Tax=Ilex paraguariensis TaxID=185542 RepID=A0ABC8RYM2_9AQUA